MAIDSSILLRGIVPDAVGAAQQGLALGQSIRNAPILRRLNEQKVAQGEQQARLQEQNMALNEQRARQNDQTLASGNLTQGENESKAIYSMFGDQPLTMENYGQAVRVMQQQGIPLEEDDLIPTEENISDLNLLRETGKRFSQGSQKGGVAAPRAFEGDFTFKDEAGNYFSQTTFTDANTQQTTARLTDVSGNNANPVGKLTPVSTTGESAQIKRERDLQSQVDAQKKIIDAKSKAIPEDQRQQVLGAERGKIETSIKQGAQQSRRSRSNLLRLKRGLDLVSTGRLAAGQDLLGSMIPGVRSADAEVFNSLASQFALDELSKQSGTKTDFDFKKAAETQARLGNTQEANNRIIEIALDRFDEIEQEERQFKEFLKTKGNAEDFEFTPVPAEHIDFVRAHKDDKKILSDFKAKYGYTPTGL